MNPQKLCRIEDALVANGVLSAILKAEKDQKEINLVAKPMFVIMDGGQAQFTSGENVPAPKKVVSDNGTVSTSGFEYIQTGLTFNCEIRDSTIDTCRLTLEVGVSSVVGFVENTAPITNRQEFSTSAYIKSSGVYLLGSVKRDSQSHENSGFLGWMNDDNTINGIVQIWTKCYRIN